MTHYLIRPGYNSGASSNNYSVEEEWELLKDIVEVNNIKREHLDIEYKEYEGSSIPSEFLEAMFIRKDKSIVIDDSDKIISMSASGDGESRRIKEGVRRAMCRLILKHAHKQHLEISIVVS